MRIAMIGTRGVPARYGGFETAVEEIGRRLVRAGHEVVVYCRGGDSPGQYLGMDRVVLPAVRHPVAETLSHSALSVGHVVAGLGAAGRGGRGVDAAIVFNAANAVLVPVLRAAGVPVAVHVDGLEWKRAKWGRGGRRWYLWGERWAVRWADELIADSAGIQEYYQERYGVGTRLLAYGAPVLSGCDAGRLAEVGLAEGGYHLVVARLEPENHVDVIVEGYRASGAGLPLVVVGSVPYPTEHERRVRELADSDGRIRLLGGVWDQDLLNSLYAGCATYVHGHSVGGTNPSLLRAMGAGAATLAFEVSFNRDVLGGAGWFFEDAARLAGLLERAEADRAGLRVLGEAARVRVSERYRWDDVAAGYEAMCSDLASGRVRRRRGRKVIDLRQAAPGAVQSPAQVLLDVSVPSN